MNTRPAIASSANTRAAFASFALEFLGKHRHERRIERALAEQAAKQVRKAEGDEERIGHQRRSERGGDEDVAQKAEHAAEQRQAADGSERSVELHRMSGVTVFGFRGKGARLTS